MNHVHRIDLPRIVLLGEGVIDSIGDVCSELDLDRPLIVTGKKTYEIAGGRAKAILEGQGFDVKLNFCAEADLRTVEGVRKEAEAWNAEAIIGVGGGRTIDVAKLSAFKSGAFFVSVPTTASHDGIASSSASIKDSGKPYSMKAKSPIAVLADSSIIEDSPYRFTASGCGDVVGKAVSVQDWRLAHDENGEYYGEYAASLALMSSQLIIRNSLLIRERLQEGYRTLLEALVSCGVAMSIAGSSRPCSGSEHLFSHTLDVIDPGKAFHGEQCGIGAILMAKLHGLNWTEIRESLRIIGAPTTAKEIGVDRKTIVEALVKAKDIRSDRYTILDKVNLSPRTAEILASECGVI